jgi:spermidine synthase
LAPDGLLVCQSYSPEEAPRVYWTIGKTMEAAGLHLLSYHLEVPSFGDWGFHVGARQPLTWGKRRVGVPCTTVPDDLSPWFRFPRTVRARRNAAVVNTLDQLVLHKIYADEVR